MKRGKKILINMSIIIILLIATYYLGGFYFSKDACAKECMQANYQGNGKILTDLEVDNTIYAMCEGKEENMYVTIKLEKIGFLYRSKGMVGIHKTLGEEILDICGWADDEDGEIIFIHRNNPGIATIEVELEDGRNVILNKWSYDCTAHGLELEGPWIAGEYRCYDKNGELIGEIRY